MERCIGKANGVLRAFLRTGLLVGILVVAIATGAVGEYPKGDTGDTTDVVVIKKEDKNTEEKSTENADGSKSFEKKTHEASYSYEKNAPGVGTAAGGGAGANNGLTSLDYMLSGFSSQYPTEPRRPASEEDFVDFSDFVTDSIDLYYRGGPH